MFQWGVGVFQMGDFIFKGWGAGGIGFGEGGGLKKILRCRAPPPHYGKPCLRWSEETSNKFWQIYVAAYALTYPTAPPNLQN